MTIKSPSGLETADYNTAMWVHIYNNNVELLNDTLLKISGLLDIDTTDLADGAILMWDGANWVPKLWDGNPN